MNFSLHHGDCLEFLKAIPDNTIDSIVTDPPYGLSFMGKKWDCDVPSVEIWAECLRALKPGGHLLAFAGTRTQHRMCCRIEDAGFEIRDMIAWMYGSGFPKSHNGEWGGTALKPAIEPITMARKPLIGTVEANWREYGTGALNIDGCRVPAVSEADAIGIAEKFRSVQNAGARENAIYGADVRARSGAAPHDAGRFPANLIHDGSDEVLACFPDSNGSGPARKLIRAAGNRAGDYGMNAKQFDAADLRDAGTGSAARFFYCAKASRSDRNDGLTDPGPLFKHGTTLRMVESANTRGNNHPTVKPTDLMVYLCRLVTPPGGVVLDPFMGSGSTGKAAVREGFGFIGIEREAEYIEIARARIEGESAKKCVDLESAQFDLFGEGAA